MTQPKPITINTLTETAIALGKAQALNTTSQITELERELACELEHQKDGFKSLLRRV